MHLSTAPLLAAEVPGCAQEQLDRLSRSVEARRQQLEEDINAYIARKQDELRRYESEVGQVMPHCRAFPRPHSRRHYYLYFRVRSRRMRGRR
jgi:hypothetical protein